MTDWDALKTRLGKSKVRSRFRLGEREQKILAERGFQTIENHCREILRERIAPAEPENDGKQTPMRGHPCFIAQHATGICCRNCLKKWHGISMGRILTEQELEFLVSILMCWIREHAPEIKIDRHPDLFQDKV